MPIGRFGAGLDESSGDGKATSMCCGRPSTRPPCRASPAARTLAVRLGRKALRLRLQPRARACRFGGDPAHVLEADGAPRLAPDQLRPALLRLHRARGLLLKRRPDVTRSGRFRVAMLTRLPVAGAGQDASGASARPRGCGLGASRARRARRAGGASSRRHRRGGGRGLARARHAPTDARVAGAACRAIGRSREATSARGCMRCMTRAFATESSAAWRSARTVRQ